MSCRQQIVSGNPLLFFYPYHLFHDTTNGIIFGSGGADWQGKCLEIEILRDCRRGAGLRLSERDCISKGRQARLYGHLFLHDALWDAC